MAAIASSIPDEVGFHFVQKPMSVDELLTTLYRNPSPEIKSHFEAVNGHIKNNYVRPGQLVIVSPPNTQQCTAAEADLSEAAAIVDKHLENLTAEEAVILTENFALLNSIASYSGTGYGLLVTYLSQHKKQVESILKEIEKLYVDSYNKSGKLNTNEFLTKRRALFRKLDSTLKTMIGRFRMGIDFQRGNLKRSLGISTKSAVHQWKQQGGKIVDVPQFAENYGKVAKYAKTLKYGGYVGIGLDVGQSGLKIYEACSLGSEKQCTRSKYSEGGRLVGSVGGGIGGGAVAAYLTCNLLFGLETAGTSLLWCGIVAGGAGGYFGGKHGGELTQFLGESIYDNTYR